MSLEGGATVDASAEPQTQQREGELDDSDEWEGEAQGLLEQYGGLLGEQGGWLVKAHDVQGGAQGVDRTSMAMMSPRQGGDEALEEKEAQKPDLLMSPPSSSLGQHSGNFSPLPAERHPPPLERLPQDTDGVPGVRPGTSGTVMSGGTTNRVGTGDSTTGRPQQPKISDLAGGSAMLSGMPSLSKSATRMQLIEPPLRPRDATRPLDPTRVAPVLQQRPPTMAELAARGSGNGSPGINVGSFSGDSNQGSWHGSWSSRGAAGFESLAQMRMRGAPAGSTRWDVDDLQDDDDNSTPGLAAALPTPQLPRRPPKFSEMAKAGCGTDAAQQPGLSLRSTPKASDESPTVSPVLRSRDGTESSAPPSREGSKRGLGHQVASPLPGQDSPPARQGAQRAGGHRAASPLRRPSPNAKRPPKMADIAQRGWGTEGDKGSVSPTMKTLAARRGMTGSRVGSSRSIGSSGSGRRGSQEDVMSTISPQHRTRGASALLPGGGRSSFAAPMKKAGGAFTK